jgi:hypothetical protein
LLKILTRSFLNIDSWVDKTLSLNNDEFHHLFLSHLGLISQWKKLGEIKEAVNLNYSSLRGHQFRILHINPKVETICIEMWSNYNSARSE